MAAHDCLHECSTKTYSEACLIFHSSAELDPENAWCKRQYSDYV